MNFNFILYLVHSAFYFNYNYLFHSGLASTKLVLKSASKVLFYRFSIGSIYLCFSSQNFTPYVKIIYL